MNILDILAYSALPVLVLIAIRIISKIEKDEVKKSEQDMDKENFTLRRTKASLWVGILCSVLFGGFLIASLIYPLITSDSRIEWWICIGFAVFMSLGIFILLEYFNWQVKIEGNNIFYSNFLRKKYIYKIDQITKVKFICDISGEKVTVFMGNNKLFSVNISCIGYNLFIACLNRKESIIYES